MTWPRKNPAQAGFEPGIFRSRGGRLNHQANEAAQRTRKLVDWRRMARNCRKNNTKSLLKRQRPQWKRHRREDGHSNIFTTVGGVRTASFLGKTMWSLLDWRQASADSDINMFTKVRVGHSVAFPCDTSETMENLPQNCPTHRNLPADNAPARKTLYELWRDLLRTKAVIRATVVAV